MRFSLVALLPVVISLSTFVAAHSDHSLEAREIDGLSARDIEKIYFDNLERRDLLSEFTTRELLDELIERAPAGQPGAGNGGGGNGGGGNGGGGNGGGTFTCPYCGTVFTTAAGATQCAGTHNVNLRNAKRRK
ncbi:hypothetical protein H1R20_g10811, partial [Candolleomyces eurysporus]